MMPVRPASEQAGEAAAAKTVPTGAGRATSRRRRRAADGQVLVIFALSIFVFMGICAVVIDVSWYWANTLRVQRAADAAALAGVVDLSGNFSGAESIAVTAAGQNGYTVTNSCQADGKTPTNNPGICATPDPANDRQLDVTISAPVNTFFMRLIGITSITAKRNAKAKFELPVPMGSPLNYYGVGCFVSESGTQPVCNASPSTANGATGIPDASVANPSPATGEGAPNQLNSQGFFGGVITKGGNSENGDAYGPANDDFGGRTVNPTYSPAGVYYEVVIPSGDTNVSLYIFDPGFCAVENSPTSYGVGDHWIKGAQNPVSTYYNLWDTHGNPYATSQFTLETTSGTLFENQTGSDTALGGPSGLPACDAYHDKWWNMTSGVTPGLGPGTYYLQVTTTKVLTTQDGGQDPDPTGTSINANTNAENMYSLEVTATGTTPQVFGAGTMVAYNNLSNPNGGDQLFYLAQIPKTDAGKTLEIDLFDIGDVSSTATIYVKDPDNNTYTNATFNYTADSMCSDTPSIQTNGDTHNCSGTNVSQITTTNSSGTHPFNDSWITILVPLPSTYGSVGLTSPGETQAGWWKIDYVLANGTTGNDTTTWRVGVRGNPVHLVVP
jgi:Flp pilus assembly protein TadG